MTLGFEREVAFAAAGKEALSHFYICSDEHCENYCNLLTYTLDCQPYISRIVHYGTIIKKIVNSFCAVSNGIPLPR